MRGERGVARSMSDVGENITGKEGGEKGGTLGRLCREADGKQGYI